VRSGLISLTEATRVVLPTPNPPALVALGATRVRRSEPEPPMSAGFIVMTDPEGNEFCLD
jgi:hypothetical protein